MEPSRNKQLIQLALVLNRTMLSLLISTMTIYMTLLPPIGARTKLLSFMEMAMEVLNLQEFIQLDLVQNHMVLLLQIWIITNN